MPCEEEEDEVNRQKESKRWQNVMLKYSMIFCVGIHRTHL